MALVKFGAGISEMRGKESGVIYSRNAYGAYIKQKVSPVNPQTTKQQIQRGLMGNAAQLWRGLTEAQRLQWSAFGAQMTRINRFGDSTPYTGFSAFVKVARNRAFIGEAALDAPIAPAAFPELALGAFVPTTATIPIVFTPTPLTAGFILIFEATPPIMTGRRFVKNFYRYIKQGGSAQTSPVGAGADYVAAFGGYPAVGDYVGIRVKMIELASGWSSTPLVTGAVVAA